MKKLIILLMPPLLLCGCSNKENPYEKQFVFDEYTSQVKKEDIIDKVKENENKIRDYLGNCTYDYKYDYTLNYQSLIIEKEEYFAEEKLHHSEELVTHTKYQIYEDKDSKTKKLDYVEEIKGVSPKSTIDSKSEKKEFGQITDQGAYTIDLINNIYILSEYKVNSYLNNLSILGINSMEEILYSTENEYEKYYLDGDTLTYYIDDIEVEEDGYKIGEQIIIQLTITDNYMKCLVSNIRYELDCRDNYVVYSYDEEYQGFELVFEDQELKPYVLEEFE